MKHKKKNKGFTLIELLVVIAIIGILAGIIVFTTSSLRKRAVNNSLLTTMASITRTMSACDLEGGTIGTNTAASNPICTDIADIAETYPVLPPEVTAANYAFHNVDQENNLFTAWDGLSDVVTCTITTGRCYRN